MPSRASCVIRVQYWMTDESEKCKQEFRRCCFNYTGETGICTLIIAKLFELPTLAQ